MPEIVIDCYISTIGISDCSRWDHFISRVAKSGNSAPMPRSDPDVYMITDFHYAVTTSADHGSRQQSTRFRRRIRTPSLLFGKQP